MAGNTCDVCGAVGETHVRASGMGAISFAYCPSCLTCGAEPFGAVVATVWTCGDDLHPGTQETIRVSLERAGKTRADLDQAVRDIDQQYMTEMPSGGPCDLAN